MDEQAKKSFLINTFFLLTIGIIIYFSGKFLFSYLLPFVIASIIAWLVQKPAYYLSRKTGIKKGFCAVGLLIVFHIVIAFIMVVLCYYATVGVKKALIEFQSIIKVLEVSFSNIQAAFHNILNGLSDELAGKTEAITKNMLTDLEGKITKFLSELAADLAGGLPSFIFSSIVTLVAGCYIAKDFERLLKFVKGFLGAKIYANILKIKNIFVGSVLKIIKGYLILTLITFIELAIAFFILGIKSPILLAFLIASVDLLPLLGIGAVLIPWSVTEFILENNGMGIALLAVYIAIIVVRNFAEPKVISVQIGINPLFILLSMFAGLKVLGFFGVILIPLVFIILIKYYKNELENDRLERT